MMLLFASRVIRPTLKKASIPWCGYHGFRRGLATNLKTLGVGDMVIKQILRHADVKTTQESYIKVEREVAQAAMRKLERALKVKLKAKKRAK